MQLKDYYAALGVTEGASAEEIKRAYKKLARKHHPDVSKTPGSEAKFREIGEAYEVLGDEAKRAAYDRARARGGRLDDAEPGVHFGGDVGDLGVDYGDLFEQLFARAGRPGRRAEPMDARGQDQHVRLDIDLEDALVGRRRSITVRTPALGEDGHVTLKERTLDVDVPKGIKSGQHLRLAGQGGPGRGRGPAGDLFLEVNIKPHPRWRVDGRDLSFELPLAPWEATLGASVPVQLPSGGTIELTVPAGAIAGRKIRVKGKGIPGDPPGDLYAVLSVAVPPADGEAARAAYRTFQAAFAGWSPRAPRAGASS